jgi:ATP-dependent exoDNAse (exonuclease V) beta subunit
MENLQSEIRNPKSAMEWSARRGIRASAGSGKTYALTGHYLRCLLQDASPERMLATTFTRKAAGEILGRVLTRLASACESDEARRKLVGELALAGFDRDAANRHLLRLCRALHQVSISTIDSFFGQLLQGFRPDLGLPPDFRIIDEKSPEMEQLRLEAIRRMLAAHDNEAMIELLDGLQQGAVHRGVVSQLDQWFDKAHELFELAPPEAWSTPGTDGALQNDASLKNALTALDALREEDEFKSLAKTIASDADRARAGDWKKFLTTGLPPKILSDDPTFRSKPIPVVVIAAYQPLIEHATATRIAAHSARTAALRGVLALYHAAYCELRRKEKVLLFRDVPLALSQLLPAQPAEEIRHRLDTEIEHLLLDEFQDTNPQQYAILKPLADGIEARGDAHGLIFCVGDLKQSIYGWRGATPQIFERFGHDFRCLEWSDNNLSYRSSQCVLDAVNALFGHLHENALLAEKAPHACRWWQQYFREHRAQRVLQGYVEVVESAGEDEESDNGDDDQFISADPHFEFAARRIKTLTESAPRASLGVLVRGNDAVRRLIFALHRIGVAASAEGGSPISDDPAVGVILSALRFADHPSDSAARFHLCHSPLAEALRLAGDRVLAPSQAALDIRRALLQHGFAATVTRWVGLLAPACDARGAQRLAQLIELAEEYDLKSGARSAMRPGEFVNFVQAKMVEEPAPSPVRVMTIHRAKGLEFDIVVLPELHKKLQNPQQQKLIYCRDPETLQIQSICAYPDKELRALSPHLENVYQEYSASELREALCLLYVAMTRARQALHIVLPSPGVKKDGTPKASGLTLAGIVRAGLCTTSTPADGETLLYAHGNPDWYAESDFAKGQAGSDAPARAAYPALDLDGWPARVWKQITPSSLEGGAKKSAAELLDLGDRSQRQKGDVLHAWLSRCEWPVEEPIHEEELKAACPELSDGERDEYSGAFHNLLKNQPIAEALARPTLTDGETAEVWCEHSFAVMQDDALVTGAFDRVVIIRDCNGRTLRATLFDFKTGPQSTPAAGAATERYRPQLEYYRDALCWMLGLPAEKIETKLLFTSAGACIAL